ncbi:hypothetical protein A6A06_37440 [Streptomyces sp. CB02923]|nr:hypothetical protein A6A06_37440 [Streptomyces sp. CB02923]
MYEAADSGALDQLGTYLSDGYLLTRAADGPLRRQWAGADADTALSRLFPMVGPHRVSVREIVARTALSA